MSPCRHYWVPGAKWVTRMWVLWITSRFARRLWTTTRLGLAEAGRGQRVEGGTPLGATNPAQAGLAETGRVECVEARARPEHLPSRRGPPVSSFATTQVVANDRTGGC